ncbi:MAG TPA: ammonia-forming cytochrome c nitrite reductase subunit c552 [Symbiobacteriaceae bacterium]|jgi:nitrite reductase (cytochrome c-552)|nr:ammonia-forming cytochrome c nitrite reductase subunit c552 [Symbiobacteriaceae bacterium]
MKRIWFMIVGGLMAVAILGGSFYTYLATKRPVVENSPVTIVKIDKNETDPAAFKAAYPRHYDSYMKNAQTLPPALKYTSSEAKKSRLEQFPYMTTLWNGYAFSKEYNEARGHVYTNTDVLGAPGYPGIKRVTEKTNLTCMYCKSAEVPQLLAQMGDKFFNTKLLEGNNKELFKHPISCSDCHNPETMELRVTRPAFIEAMARRGVDVSKATRQEMRSYTCGQCHVEYFFNPKDANKVTFPWDKGFEYKDIYAYYQEQQFSDWTHPQTDGGMLKAQHPEFELFQGSTHQAAGLSCADCHMPYMKEGNTKISSHWWTSPMRTFEQSCGTCHKQSEKEMQARVLNTQDRVKEGLDRAGEANKAAIAAIEKAKNTAGVDAKKLDEARQLHRESQFYWDLVSAENSYGFHNPQKALQALADSIDLAGKAQVKAMDAVTSAAK